VPDGNTKPTMLVIGDWVVDEYWFLVKHNSEISSHTGTVHYRLSTRDREKFTDLCGAGHAVRILHTIGADQKYRLCGVGEWNEYDTEYLKHLAHARGEESCTASQASYQMVPHFSDTPPPIDLYTLVPEAATTRVVRQYHYEQGGLEQINRVDFERDEEHAEQERREHRTLDALDKLGNVTAIVVHDLAKGVVTKALVADLMARFPNAKWYVRSKNAQNDWLDKIEASLELLVIGPELATRLNPWDTLLVNEIVNPLAMKTAGAFSCRRVVLLSENREVVARFREDDGTVNCLTGRSYLSLSPVLQIGWTSAFFAALVWKLRQEFDSQSDERPHVVIEDALLIADKYGVIDVPNDAGLPKEPARKPTVSKASWQDEQRRWNESHNDCGIIDEKNGPELQAWRASPYLSSYICTIRKKQEIINDIGKALREFKRGGARRPLSILLQADPGSGKTFLAATLAKSFDFSYLHSDVSQMVHRDELFELFDTIATRQANEPGRRLLVFVDEINTILESSHVYGAFLRPLEEGVFVRRGKVFSLKPCAWIFAGTAEATDTGAQRGEKLADLRSRLTMIKRIDFESLRGYYGEDHEDELRTEAQLEQVYLAMAMIRRYFSDVRFISSDVLRHFRDIDPSEGGAPRRIRKLVESLKNVQYGKITHANCESWERPPTKGADDRLIRLSFA
jgi:hypothetical protein